MIIEFQVSASAFLTAQQATLESAMFCTPPIIQVGTVQAVIDRIEYGLGSLRHNLPASYSIDYPYLGDVGTVSVKALRTQIAQPVTVYVASLDDMLLHPNAPPSAIVAVSGTVVMDMQFYSGNAPDQNCYLNVAFTNFEPGPIPGLPPAFPPSVTYAAILNAVNSYIAAAMPVRKIPIDVVSALPVTPSKLLLVNAGVSVDAQLQTLAFQVEIGPSAVAPDAPWINFFQGIFNDRRQAAEWGIFLQGVYIAAVIQTLIDEAVSQGLPDELSLFVTSTYSNASGKAVINNDILGIYHTPWPLPDVEGNPQIPITVSVNSPDVLTIDAGVPDIQELVQSFIPGWAKIFLRFSGPVGAFLSALIDSAIAGIKAPALPPQCKRTTPANIRCTQTLSLPGAPDSVSPTITALLALDDGIALTGPMRGQHYTQGALDVTGQDFKLEAPSFSCSGAGPEIIAAFGNSPGSFDILHARVFVAYGGTMPVYLCSVTPLRDAKGVFPVNSIRWDYQQAPLTISIHPPVPPRSYYDQGAYPCVLLVKTTAGARVISIPAPPKLTQEDINRITAELVVKLGNCELLYDPWWKRKSLVDPPWEINASDRVDPLHLWEVEVQGLERGATVTLTDAPGRTVVTARGLAGRAVRVSALVVPGAARDLSIMHGAAQGLAAAEGMASVEAQRKLAITQQLLMRAGNIQLGQPCLQLHPALLMGRRCVVAVMGDGVAAFDISGLRAPRRLAAWSRPGTRGVLKWGNGLLIFGEEGLEALGGDGNTIARTAACEAAAIDAATAGRGFIFAAGAAGLSVFSSRLCGTHVTRLEHCTGLVVTAGKLIAATRNSIAQFDISEARRPQAEHTEHVEEPVHRISRPSGLDAGSFLLTTESGSVRVVKFEGRALEELAVFGQPPWFDRAVRIGNVLAMISDRENEIEISRFGPSVVL